MKRTALLASLFVSIILCLAIAPAASATPWTPDWVAPPAGHRPAPRDLSYLRGVQAIPQSRVFKAYPASYDLRTLGRVTPVKDQGSYGTCWTFASLGSLESGLLNADPTVWDFSEDNLVWFAGFSLGSDPYDDGGNSFMALAYLARWGGPVNESDDPYADTVHPAGLGAQRHLSDVVFLPPRASASDNDQIKAAVTSYGGVDVDMWWPTINVSSYWNAATNSVYTSGSHTANHDVLIVGWDDAYAAGNFATTPPGPGAFIVKNSWGSSWGDGGYFYASYYDSVLAYGGYNMAFAAAGPADDYSRAYQYDPLGYWPEDGPYVSGTTGWFANVFNAAATEDLAAVGFYSPLPNCTYEVYSNATSGTPSFAGLQVRGSGTLATAGYHVVPLTATVPLTSGQPFTVAVKITVPDATYHYPIPVEQPYAGYSTATSDPGESYVCTDGTTWRDITTLIGFNEANVCLKGFTTGVPGGTFSVNDQAAYTRSPTVELGSNMAGAAEMRFRDAGGAWSGWETFTSTRSWTLPAGDGPKTVEAEFRNAKGTATRSDAISLDTHRPTTRAPYKASVLRYQYARLYYKVSDTKPCAGKATVTIKVKTLGGTTKKTLKLGLRYVNKVQSQSYRFKCSLAKGTYRFYVYATDAAGNTQRILGRNYLYVR